MYFDAKQFYLWAVGGVNRSQRWLGLILPVFLIAPSLMAIDMTTGTYDPHRGLATLSGLFMVRAVIPSIIVLIKRFHGLDKSGLWVLIGLIPVIGALWSLIELGCLAGTLGPSRFGEPVMD